MKPIVLFGGTFDPVHIAHLRVAVEAAEALDADVRLMPAHVPPHRPQPVASAAQRVAMLECALSGQQRLSLDARELRRAGASYTYDTLAELRGEIPRNQPVAVLLGADAFTGLPTWHRWRELFDLAHFVVLTRAGREARLSPELAAEVERRRARDAADIRQHPAGRVLDLAVTSLDVSASAVRALLAQGRDPSWLLPDALVRSPLLDAYRR